MIRLTLAFMALSAFVVIVSTAERASLDTALQLALMLAIGGVIGMLWAIDRMKG